MYARRYLYLNRVLKVKKMIKYYLIKNKLLVKGDVLSPKGGLVENAFVYRDGNWQEVNPDIINDRIIGFDPFDDSIYGMGNAEIMDELQEISEEEANNLIKGRE